MNTLTTELQKHLDAFDKRFDERFKAIKKSVVRKMIEVSGQELIKLHESQLEAQKKELREKVEKLDSFPAQRRVKTFICKEDVLSLLEKEEK